MMIVRMLLMLMPAFIAAPDNFPKTINFLDLGALPNDYTQHAAWHNGGLLNSTLNSLSPGDTLIIPEGIFHVMGGILVTTRLRNNTIRLDGTLFFSRDIYGWPRTGDGKNAPVLECLHFKAGADNVVFTSNGAGTVQGNGRWWWGFPGIGYLERLENRPKLFRMDNMSTSVLLEKWHFFQSPYWTVSVEVHGLEIRDCSIVNRRSPRARDHNIYEMTAFNTDGFDVRGRNIWIHHCRVWNQDDTFCVKDNTQDVLIEHVTASGVGLTIGSIASHVRNVTFRNLRMKRTYMGIYMKFRGPGLIEDVLYENIVMEGVERYGVWIGPAQQSDSKEICAARPCSICWPLLPGANCYSVADATFRNVMLRNITIASPFGYAGVILGNGGSPMKNITFEDVLVIKPKMWNRDYLRCKGVESGVATGNTYPVPYCFKDLTTRKGGVAAVTSIH